MEAADSSGRFARQVRFDGLGVEGQAALRMSEVFLAGVGAVGSHCAELLVRAGVRTLHLIDRDIVEEANLAVQLLYTQDDALEGRAKAVAAKEHLERVSTESEIHAIVRDITPRTAPEILLERVDRKGARFLLDATDNFTTRYLLADHAFRSGIPYIYAGAVGSLAASAIFPPGESPCLRCLFPEVPPPGSFPTCATEGILGPAAASAAALAVGSLMRALSWGSGGAKRRRLVNLDVFTGECRSMELTAAFSRAECPCRLGGDGQARPAEIPPVTDLCGGSYQVNPPDGSGIDLDRLAERLERSMPLRRSERILHVRFRRARITIFDDGRALVRGVPSGSIARQLCGELMGT